MAGLLKDSACGERGGIIDNTIRDRVGRLLKVLTESETKEKTVHGKNSAAFKSLPKASDAYIVVAPAIDIMKYALDGGFKSGLAVGERAAAAAVSENGRWEDSCIQA